MKHIGRLLLILAVTLVLAVTGLTLWLKSGSALQWALSEALQHTGGALKIASSEGALDRVMLLKGVEWDSGSLHVHVDTLKLQWRPVALFIRRADLSSVQAEGLRLEIRSDGESKPLTFPLKMPSIPHLPVALRFGDVQVHDAIISLSPALPPIHLDRAEFSARIDNDGIQVHELDAEGPDISVQGDVKLSPNQDYAVDAVLDWRYRIQGWAPLQGRTGLKGDDHSLLVSQNLAAPYGAVMDGTLKDAFEAPKWDGKLKLARFALAAVHPGWPTYGGDTNLTFRGDPASTGFKGDATVRGAPFGSTTARFDTALRGKALDIHTLALTLAGGGKLDLKGSLGLSTDVRTSLSGSWQDLSWPPGTTELRSPQGTLRLEGDRDTWRASLAGTLAPKATVEAEFTLARGDKHAWTLSADARGLRGEAALPEPWMKPLLPQGRWQLAAHGDLDSADVDRLTGRWLGGTLTATGHYQHRDQSWRAEATVQDADPARLSTDWPGKLDAVLDAHGQFGEQAHAVVQLDSLKGTLRGSPLQANGNAAFTGKVWQQLAVDAKLGDDTLHVDGDAAGGQKLHWQLDAPSLAQAWPDASGVLHSHGTLDGGQHYTLLDLNLDLAHFAWHRYQADSVQLAAHASGDSGGEAVLHAVDLALPGIVVQSLDAQAYGGLAHHALKVQVASDRGTLKLAGTGAYTGGHWQASLPQVDLTPTGAGEWRAASPWSLTLASHVLKLPLACLLQDQAEVCASLDSGPAGWQAHGSIKTLPLSALQSVLPAGLTYTGTLDAALTASGAAATHHLDLDATLSPGSVSSSAGGKQLTLLDYTGGEAHLHSNPRATTGHVGWQLTDGGSLSADVRLAGTPQTLSGRIKGDMHDFELVPALLPQVSQAKGRLLLDVALAGTPADPLFSGSAAFTDGEVAVPRIGLHMTALQVKLDGDGGKLKLDGSAHSGDGDMNLSADARHEAGIWHVQGKLQGQDFRSVDIPEAQVDLSPDISFAVDDRKIRLDGTVTVPHALLRPRDLAGSAQVSADQVIVGEEGGLPQEKWHLRSQLRIVLGPDVDFAGFGLSGGIGGEVTAVDEPGHATTGSGELNIRDGQYVAFKQKLAIEYGRLIFTGGPISDPALDIRAVRAAAHPELTQLGAVEQKVGVIVRGTLREPAVTLFSDPPLTQAQATNYLLFGNAGLESGAGSALSTPGVVTASSLSSNSNASQSQMPNVTIPVGGGVIASDFSIQSVQNGTTYTPAWMLGKYLSPRLYVSYGQGINDPFYFFRVIYTLSTKWILQAQTGVANSADIIYTLEH